jgi:hypothetical protein
VALLPVEVPLGTSEEVLIPPLLQPTIAKAMAVIDNILFIIEVTSIL